MRIGFDAKRIFHNFRGLGNYSRTLVEGLQKYYPDNEYLLYTPPFNDGRAEEWLRKYPNFEVVKPSGVLSRNLTSVWRSLLLSNTLKKDQLDIYHGLSHELPPGIQKACKKSVVTIHDLIFLRFPEFFPWIDRKDYFKKFTHACESADLVLAICEQTKSDLIEFLKVPEEKIRVAYQSCHPRFYNKVAPADIKYTLEKAGISQPYILYVGAIEERKNALSLVKAFSRIDQHRDHQLVLIGRGKEYLRQIEKTVTELGLTDQVKILSNIEDPDLPALFQGAKLFCYPSFFEGFGIPILQALFSEVPVITSTGSCFPEAGGVGTVYIDPKDIEELACEISNVLEDDEKQAMMKRVGREHVEKFHWQNTSGQLNTTFRELL